MTPDQVHLIRKTYAILERYNDVAALIFYRRLFEIEPGLRSLFTSDIELQSRKLMDMLGSLIAMLESPAGLDAELRAMGVRHAGYGVKEEHYDPVGVALLDMLADTLGEECDAEVVAAWTELYSAVEAAMKAGAAEVSQGGKGA